MKWRVVDDDFSLDHYLKKKKRIVLILHPLKKTKLITNRQKVQFACDIIGKILTNEYSIKRVGQNMELFIV